MEYIFDIALVVIVLICAFIGKKVGFVRCVLNLIKSIAAFILAKFAADHASVYVFDNFIEKYLTDKIRESLYISSRLPGETVWESLPSFVQSLLEKSGINSENIFTVSEISTLGEMTDSTIKAIEQILLPFISLLFLVLFFIIVFILLGLLIKLIDKIFKLPVLNSLNSFLGTVVGILFGVFIIFILSLYLNEIILILPEEASVVVSNLSETSIIRDYLAGII